MIRGELLLRRSLPLFMLFALAGLLGCDDKHAHDHPHPHPHDGDDPHATETAEHGEATDLGSVQVAGREFQVVLLGDVAPGQEGAFEVRGVGIPDAELAKLNLYLWLESEDGTQLSAPAKGELEGDGLHFHAMPRAGKGDPHQVVIRLRAGDTDERGGLPLGGHGHDHHDEPHHGVPDSNDE